MTQVYTGKLTVITCCSCGIVFGINSEYFDNAILRDGTGAYCPNGHALTWGKGEVDRLRADKLRLEAELQFRTQEMNEARRKEENAKRQAKAEVTRRRNVIKRVDNGCCPHCKRHFVKLQNHIESKHKDKASAEKIAKRMKVQ